MNVNQIINMAMKMIMRKVMSRGIDAGMNMASKKSAQPQEEEPNLTKEERARLQQSKDNSKRAKQAMKVTRKIGRF